MPEQAADLWDWLAVIDRDSRDVLLADVVAQSVNTAVVPHGRKARAIHDTDRPAWATGLAMRDYWTPTVPSYLGRVTKATILQALSEGVSVEAAQRLESLTKAKMAREAESLLTETDWLPARLRTVTDKAGEESEPVTFAEAAE